MFILHGQKYVKKKKKRKGELNILASHASFCTSQQLCDADVHVKTKLQNEMALEK